MFGHPVLCTQIAVFSSYIPSNRISDYANFLVYFFIFLCSHIFFSGNKRQVRYCDVDITSPLSIAIFIRANWCGVMDGTLGCQNVAQTTFSPGQVTCLLLHRVSPHNVIRIVPAFLWCSGWLVVPGQVYKLLGVKLEIKMWFDFCCFELRNWKCNSKDVSSDISRLASTDIVYR